MEKVKVDLCMGSSCFSRGNSQALANLEAYIDEFHLQDKIELVGHLCMDNCNKGPNILIDGVEFSGLNPDCVVDLVAHALEKKMEADK